MGSLFTEKQRWVARAQRTCADCGRELKRGPDADPSDRPVLIDRDGQPVVVCGDCHALLTEDVRDCPTPVEIAAAASEIKAEHFAAMRQAGDQSVRRPVVTLVRRGEGVPCRAVLAAGRTCTHRSCQRIEAFVRWRGREDWSAPVDGPERVVRTTDGFGVKTTGEGGVA